MNKLLFALIIAILLIPLGAFAEMHGALEIGHDFGGEYQYVNIKLTYDFFLLLDQQIYGGT